MIIKELYKYFSAFVPAAALEKSFQASEGSDYDTFKTSLANVSDARRIAGITSYIFGIDADRIRETISSVEGIYLFVDYSTITSTIDEKVDRKDDRMHVAITVAEPQSHERDQVATMLSQDNCLQIIRTIRAAMRNDDETVRWMVFPSTIQPFANKALANSLGWTMEFDIIGVDIA